MLIDIKQGLGRTLNLIHWTGKTKVIKTEKSFRPYFYSTKRIPYGQITKTVQKKVFWNKKRVKAYKTCFEYPQEIPKIRDNCRCAIFESDIRFLYRYAIDNPDTEPVNLPCLFFDIETLAACSTRKSNFIKKCCKY